MGRVRFHAIRVNPRWLLLAVALAAGLALAIVSAGFVHRTEPGSVWQPPQAGMPPPRLALPDTAGRTHSLEEHEGKPVVLYFWTSFCPYCREGLPAMERIYRELGPPSGDLVVLAINVGEEPEVVRQAAQALGFSFPALLDTSGEAARKYFVRAVPALFFIARDGILQSKLVGVPSPAAVEGQLRQLLLRETARPTAVTLHQP